MTDTTNSATGGAQIDLLSCPFCGGEPHMQDDGESGYWIECTSAACGSSTNMRIALMDDVRPVLIEQWNRRAALARAGQQAGAAASIDYTPGSWFEARTLDEMQAFYLSRLPAIREAAKDHGYAIGLHGSTRRDFDLMAMQWSENASDKDTLAHAIAMAACGITRQGGYMWECKPSGRFAVSLPVCWTDHGNPDFDKPSMGHIDLSVIDRPAACSAAVLEPVEGDKLPPVGSKVLIHLGRQDAWVEHTVTGYYAWGDLGGNDSLHRVFVRVVDADGIDNARLLKDVRPTAKGAAGQKGGAA